MTALWSARRQRVCREVALEISYLMIIQGARLRLCPRVTPS